MSYIAGAGPVVAIGSVLSGAPVGAMQSEEPTQSNPAVKHGDPACARGRRR